MAEVCGEVSMFESVKQGAGQNTISYFVSFLISVATHAVILGAMVSLPLIFYSPLRAHSPVVWFMDSPDLSKKAPPPPSSSTAAAKEHTAPDSIIHKGPFIPPEKIPYGIPPATDLPEPAGIYQSRAGGGIAAGIHELESGSLVEDLLSEAVPDLAPPKPPDKPKVVRAFSELQESKLIYRVNPVYSELALKARVSGKVVLAAVINEEGSVTDLRVLSGHPLLRKSAVDAVSQWKYLPTILNGEPVSVSALVTVVFRIR
jgi:TonB family protein